MLELKTMLFVEQTDRISGEALGIDLIKICKDQMLIWTNIT